MEKSIDEITFLEIVRTMEGVDICANLDAAFRQKETQMFLIFSRVNEELEELFSKYTVRDLFEFYEAGYRLSKQDGLSANDPAKNISNHEYGTRPIYAGNRRERRVDKTKGSVRILKDEIKIK